MEVLKEMSPTLYSAQKKAFSETDALLAKYETTTPFSASGAKQPELDVSKGSIRDSHGKQQLYVGSHHVAPFADNARRTLRDLLRFGDVGEPAQVKSSGDYHYLVNHDDVPHVFDFKKPHSWTAHFVLPHTKVAIPAQELTEEQVKGVSITRLRHGTRIWTDDGKHYLFD